MTNNFKQKNEKSVIPAYEPESIIQNTWMPGRARHDKRRSFTLIELLVVLALVAILSVIVVMTLNPAELLKQARDSNRLSDLSTINTALNLFSTDVIGGFMGTSTVVYVSLPSTTSNCSNLGLPSLPTGYTYNCVTSANLRNTDGTGWIPVNFNRISSNSPVSQLPIDPTNTTSTRLYYTYTPGGSWELNATVEASKNKLGGSNDLVSKDGGSSPSQYEIGNNLNLSPIETGDPTLVGYWNFEEGPNSTSSDRSGYGNNGTWYGTSTAQQHYTTGKVGSYAGSFNGSSDYVEVSSSTSLSHGSGNFSYSIWYYSINDLLGNSTLIATGCQFSGGARGMQIRKDRLAVNTDTSSFLATPAMPISTWFQFIAVRNGSNVYGYLNGVLVSTNAITGSVDGSLPLAFGSRGQGCHDLFASGFIDDIRIYNRALSATEVLALYSSTK